MNIPRFSWHVNNHIHLDDGEGGKGVPDGVHSLLSHGHEMVSLDDSGANIFHMQSICSSFAELLRLENILSPHTGRRNHNHASYLTYLKLLRKVSPLLTGETRKKIGFLELPSTDPNTCYEAFRNQGLLPENIIIEILDSKSDFFPPIHDILSLLGIMHFRGDFGTRRKNNDIIPTSELPDINTE